MLHCHNVSMLHWQQCVMAVNIAVLYRVSDAEANVLDCRFQVM